MRSALFRQLASLIAGLHRQRLGSTVFVGITGTAGKTTAKDLTGAVLASLGDGIVSPGNYNGLRTVVKSLLRARSHHRYCVHELATHGPGTIAALVAPFRPDIGVVLNVGLEHYTEFRSREAVALEKGRLVEVLPPTGTAILNADDPLVLSMATRTQAHIVTFGLSTDADVRAEAVTSAWPDPLRFNVCCDGARVPIATQLHGMHWIPSVLAAVAVGRCFGVSLEQAARAIASQPAATGRLESVRCRDGVTFLRDDQKFPYWNVDIFLRVVAEARAMRKVIVFGTLSDYPGSGSPKYRSIARRALDVADVVIFVGERSTQYVRKVDAPHGRLVSCADVSAAERHLRTLLHSGDLVFLKGSVDTDKLETLTASWEEPDSPAPAGTRS